MLGFVILSLASLANLVVGLLVLMSSPGKLLNRLFFFLSLSLIGWTTANQLSLVLTNPNQVFKSVNWLIFFVVIQNTLFFEFIRLFLDKKTGVFSPLANRIFISYSFFVSILAAMHMFFSGFTQDQGTISLVPSSLMPIFMLHALYSIFFSLSAIAGRYHRAPINKRRQLKTLLISSVVLFVVVPLTNFIAPIFFDSQLFISLSPIYTFIFALLIAYSIFRQHLFDIRLLVARSVAYLGLLGSIAAFYAGMLAVATSFLDLFGESESVSVIANILTIFLLALTFQPLKEFFNRITNRIFYRDSYSPQKILDQLSTLLATEIDLRVIVNQSTQIISTALKPSYIRFAVFKDGETYVDHKHGEANHAKLSRGELSELPEMVLLKESASGSAKQFFKRHDAEVLLKLKTNEEIVGVILLGPKQSGTVYSKQDIDLLTISEKELAIAVQNSRYFEQIQEFNVKLQKEVTDATSELRASNTKLKELDEAKDEFISMASHQLRTPLTSVKGYISMVNEGDAGKVTPAQRKLLDEAFASSQRMVYLIADLLNVSRLRTGKFVIEPAEVYLPDVVKEEVHQLEPTARSRKLKLVFDKPARFPKVWLDETKIRQVVMNFIDNAIYYTPAGGRIEIRLTAKKDGIEYTVRDNGIGVPKEEQAKLFTKFYRAGNAKQARPDGTGLGLYMAQRVVSAQGGSVVFRSEPGKGSTFGFFFPFKSVKTKQSLEKVAATKQNQSEPSEL